MGGRKSLLAGLSVADVSLLVSAVAVEKLRPAALWRSLPERIRSVFTSPESLKAVISNHLKKVNMVVTAVNVDSVARAMLGRLGTGPHVEERDRSPSPRSGAPQPLVTGVQAGPDIDPYDVLMRYSPVDELRVPPLAPEARRVYYSRVPHPTDGSLDILRFSIVVLRDSVVRGIQALSPHTSHS